MSAHAFEVLLAEDSSADAELVMHSLAEEELHTAYRALGELLRNVNTPANQLRDRVSRLPISHRIEHIVVDRLHNATWTAPLGTGLALDASLFSSRSHSLAPAALRGCWRENYFFLFAANFAFVACCELISACFF